MATLDQKIIEIPRPALITSLIIHGSLFFMFVTVKILDHFGIHLMGVPFVHKSDAQNFVQVDIVGLPDQLLRDKFTFDSTASVVEKPEKSQELKPAISLKKDEMALPSEDGKKDLKSGKKETKAEKRMSEEEKALKQLELEAHKEQALKALAQAKSAKGKEGRKKIAGNILSQGTAATGSIGTPKDRYNELVTQAIRSHFSVYSWQKNKNLVALVHIELFPTGRVRSKQIVKSSGDRVYDQATLEAIEEAQPLPLPDDPSYLVGGITINFTPEGK